jgi:cytochrome P450
VRLGRKPNPHLAFGFGAHLCIGAAHARLLVRTLLHKCTARVGGISVLESVARIEKEAAYERRSGYESLTLRITPL